MRATQLEGTSLFPAGGHHHPGAVPHIGPSVLAFYLSICDRVEYTGAPIGPGSHRKWPHRGTRADSPPPAHPQHTLHSPPALARASRDLALVMSALERNGMGQQQCIQGFTGQCRGLDCSTDCPSGSLRVNPWAECGACGACLSTDQQTVCELVFTHETNV